MLRIGIAAYDDLPGGLPQRVVEARRNGTFRVGHYPHRRVTPPEHVRRSRAIRTIGYDHLDGTGIVLGRYGVEGGWKDVFRVARRFDLATVPDGL